MNTTITHRDSVHDLAAAAGGYAAAGWEVFPLAGKAPLIRSAHPPGDGPPCRRGCGRDGHGVLDATADPDRVAAWWDRWPRANIGGRVPAGVFVIDADPRHGGDCSLAALEQAPGALPGTLRCYSGRGDGGAHLYFTHPGGRISAAFLGPGIDVKTHSGYVVLPPSLHPDSGRPYRWADPGVPVAAAPAWLTALLRPPPPPARPAGPSRSRADGESIADWFSSAVSWGDVLGPYGWRCVAGDGDGDGSAWLHPAASSPCSATVRHGQLFVYSTSTVFTATEPGCPAGYTRFRAFAVLAHGGDLRAAAIAAAGLRGGL